MTGNVKSFYCFHCCRKNQHSPGLPVAAFPPVEALKAFLMHYYQFNIGDYASHTQHLDELEDLAYRRMLDYCYLNECGLPETVERVARVIRMQLHCNSVANVLQEYFEQREDGTWHNKRIDKEISDYHEKSGKRADAAHKRWEKARASALQNKCKSNANHKPLTINQEPITNNQKPDINLSSDKFNTQHDKSEIANDAENNPCPDQPVVKKSKKQKAAELDYSCWPDKPSEQVMTDWLDMRKRLKAPVSQTVINQLGSELFTAFRAGYSVDYCLSECVTRGWRGFKFEWINKQQSVNQGGFYDSERPETEQERIRRLSKSASGRVTLNAERELARIAEQEGYLTPVGNHDTAVRPPLDFIVQR